MFRLKVAFCKGETDILATGVGTYSIRELCDRLSCRWKIRAASVMGYGRPRRLRTITTTCIFKSTCYTDWFLRRYARLTGQCQAQGKIATSRTSFKPTVLNPCQWVEEANERCPGVPILLVGLKKDLREDPLAQDEMRKSRCTSRQTVKGASQHARSEHGNIWNVHP